jgi:transposase
MLGKREPQADLFTADTQYLQFVGEDTFYGFLARHGRELFRDEDFAKLYCTDNGRTSVPPSRLCLALLLQAHDRVSDEEAKRRADVDLGWKVALGVGVATRPFAKSTLQMFRAQLVIHQEAKAILQRSLGYAKRLGYLKQRRKLRVALDTSFILGRGAVEDTYNLVAEGIRVLSRALAKVQGMGWEGWLAEHALARYGEPSIKGAAEVEWEDAASREAFLTGLIEDGERVLEITRGVRAELEAGGGADRKLEAAAAVLSQLLWQDVEPTARGYRIKQGTAKDRIPSVHDPEQRHGHKSDGRSFTGHKVGVAVEVESQLITAVEVMAGNASDGKGAVSLVEASETNTGREVEQVLGDTAYGSMAVREALGNREVIAPTVKPRLPKEGEVQISKADFSIDTEAEVVRCPQGQETREWRVVKVRGQETKCFTFPGVVCQACPRVGACVNATRRNQGLGREVTLHPQEAQLQAARAFEQTDSFKKQYRQRSVVEHRLARLMALGLRQARCVGHAKVLLQAVLAATVANLTLLMGR